MQQVFLGTCPKDNTMPESNEDYSVFDANRNRFALCDGASESFDSKLWGRILAEKYIGDNAVTQEWIRSAIDDYGSCHDRANLSWSKQAAFDRGSFATLLGVEHDPGHSTVEILAVGDTLAVLVDGTNMVESWPFSDPEQFKERPTLFCTLSEHNSFIDKKYFWNSSGKIFELDRFSSPLLLCMTDALGEWTLREVQSGRDSLALLAGLSSEQQLIDLVPQERAAKRMKVDDSTLAILSFASSS